MLTMVSLQYNVILLCCVWSYSNAFFKSDIGRLSSRRHGSGVKTNALSYGGEKKSYIGNQGIQNVDVNGDDDLFSGAVPTYEGGCSQPPIKPPNSKLRCSFYSGCSLSCETGYSLPGDVYAIYIMCENGEWVVQDTGTKEMPSCQPSCSPPCQNQGICIAPEQCSCPEKYSGPQCQFENKPCLELPPLPQNSRRLCRKNQEYCSVECFDGHQFPDGSAIATLTCKNGLWVPGRDDWVSIPDCQATCSPSCQNGGVCLSLNVCQCPQDYRGSQCQYSVKACSRSKLNFNGGYNCSGDSEQFVCSGLFCADGMKLSHDPAPTYTCKYSEGVFYPSSVPTCTNVDSSMNSSRYTSFVKEASADYNSDKTLEAETTPVIIENKLPTSGVCYTWGAVHYKTFDGKLYSFDSECAYTLIQDSVDNTFSVTIENAKSCYSNDSICYKIINIYIQGRDYKLNITDHGNPLLTQSNRVLPIPGQAVGIRTERTGRFLTVLLDSVGVTLKWDAEKFIQVETKESLWNRTEGLCGKIDGNPDNDIVTKDGRRTKNVVTAAASWQVNGIGDVCQSAPIEKRACPNDGVKGSLSNKAHSFCSQLLSDSRFSACSNVLDRSHLIHACSWDYCNCYSTDKSDCACDTMNVYVSECKHKHVTSLASWRDSDTCPMKCSGDKIYKACGPTKGQPTCGSTTTTLAIDPETCEEGCFCPEGKVLHNDECISPTKCPCRLRNKEFPAGSSVPKDCNTCTCDKGHWVCTQVSCGARCSAVGDPHYTTFDGKKYDFMGQCSYYLVVGSNFSIETENVACPGAISELLSFAKSSTSELASCTKTATIKINGSLTVKLRQNSDVLVNGQEINKLPLETSGVKIRSISSIFLQVELPNGIEIWWDGVSRIYIDMPASFKDQTKGLCGTFNQNQKDDFLTPEGDIEQSIISFANKWKTQETCMNVPNKIISHPCDVNMHRRSDAEKLCATIKSKTFADCNFYVDPEQYYHDCMYDICSCQGDLTKCLCTIIASYAHECASKGIKISWRADVTQCGIQCSAGQKYQVCGDSCSRSCYDISTRPNCRTQCVEGCNCPEGEALDDNGECIPVGQCKCYSNGLVFNPGYKEIRRIESKPDLCACMNGGWTCTKATEEDIKLYPDAGDLKSMCNATSFMEFTSCEPAVPKTCKNMYAFEQSSPAVCQPGCQCKEGYVLDAVTRQCIKPTDCPCHHGGRSYTENEIVQNDCNTCTCKSGKWSCTDRQCAAECSAWGDSHYKTFDGKHYDYQGQCDYILAKGSLGNLAAFDISIQNVPCGTLGITCSKSITIRVGAGKSTESITLSIGKHLPKSKNFNHLTIRKIGLYVIIEAPDLGLSVRWDRGTRVYVRLNPKWKNEVKGLCGNYNDNELDDFQTPSGGVTEVSPYAFGDSWKLEPYCPEAKVITDTCAKRPERKVWAMKQCGILKSSIFSPCHSEVAIGGFYDKCLFDTCACDQGGDCQCLCTALAAYAQECNNRGVPIHWRSQDLCPIQCEEKCSTYKPCMSTCLIETCDNIYTRGKVSVSCSEDTCVEGCAIRPCPPGQVYQNSSFEHCVPVNECRTVCMQINGVIYFEGDVISEDSCHTCYCSRGQQNCKGRPCTQVPVTSTMLPTMPEDQNITCVTGWSEWINQNPIVVKEGVTTRPIEREPLPTSILLNKLVGGGKCSIDKMIDIECRTVRSKITAKETGLDAECSLERGLYCKSSRKGSGCPDFEIRVLCQCELPTRTTTETTETMSVYITGLPECDSKTRVKPDDKNCYEYYVCINGRMGAEYVKQSCGETMMFNPKTLSCDTIQTVSYIRPECAQSTTSTSPEMIITGKPECSAETPNKPHETDCHKYYVCDNGPNGAVYVEQTCGRTMMYNPETLTCDHIYKVEIIRPECARITTGVLRTTKYTPSPTTRTAFVTMTAKPKCNSETPNKPDKNDCRKFYVCEDGPDGPEYVERVCHGTMMYNPHTLSCDRSDIVALIRPECAESTTTTTTTEASTLIIITGKPECNSEIPNKPHETDCHKYYVCDNGPHGAVYVEQTCGDTMMYNPETLTCDHIDIVTIIRPECARTTTAVYRTSKRISTPTTSTAFVTMTAKPKCNSETPNKPDFEDCQKFYVCEDGPDGPKYVERICRGTMMYNPKTLSCDRIDIVSKLRPECAELTTITTATEATTTVIVITGKPECSSETPNKPHETDCHKYYICDNGPNGAVYVEQSCGRSMMYNPQTLKCDNRDVVALIRPECAEFTTVPSTTRKRVPTGTTRNAFVTMTAKPTCNWETPNKPDEKDCRKFYVCEDGPDGPEYVERICKGAMMYNPETLSCDRADIVSLIRPECAESTTTTTTTETSTLIIITGKPECSSETPNKPHETDCHKYYVCDNGPDGAVYVEQTCGDTMMYNPETLTCDHIDIVTIIRPECARTTTAVYRTSKRVSTPTTSTAFVTMTAKPKCNSETPNKPDFDDCQKFYVCEDGPDGPKYVERICRGTMMYNPKTLSCDRIDIVSKLRPECAELTTITTATEATTTVIVVTGKPECSSETPNKPHETDCHKYYVCDNGPNGAVYVEQSCGRSMMYNPETLKCDNRDVVALFRPECAEFTTVPSTTRKRVSTGTTGISFVTITAKPKCSWETPNKPDEKDCRKFYVCEDGPDGPEYVERICRGTMMYNPETLNCDRADIVSLIRPECAESTTTTTTTETSTLIIITGKPECSSETPNKPHETDCHKYYVCDNGPDGAVYVEQSCGDTMMYNPETLTCDHIDIVTIIRPECARTTTAVYRTSKRISTPTTSTAFVTMTAKPRCNSETPNKPDFDDCQKFYVCEDGPDGPKYVERICRGTMMYNPKTLSCDRIDIVSKLRPECAELTTITTATEATTTVIVITGKPECSSETPNKPHETDCHKYYVCDNGPNGAVYVEQSCGRSMMYNPETLKCDNRDVVALFRPECAEFTTVPSTTRKRVSTGTTGISFVTITGKPRTECSWETPDKPDEKDCRKYYVCEDGPDGPEYVERICKGTMMYNPETLSCDRADIVSLIRPECGESTIRTTTTETSTLIIITGKPECSSETPNKPHEIDCDKYYVCDNGPNGAVYVEQTCGGSMMYNPKTLKCDNADVVADIRPECVGPTGRTSYYTITSKPQCNSETPNKLHPSDCRKFFICKDGPDGPEYVERICKGKMMYNPKTLSCDRSDIVSAIRPECAKTTPSLRTASTTETTFIIVTGKPECNSETPNKPHDTNCHMFYVCRNGPNGAEYIEQTCGKSMMFNTQTKSCDTINVVTALRPECEVPATTKTKSPLTSVETTTSTTTTTPATTTSTTTIVVTGQPECNSKTLNRPHKDCHKFYVCRNGPNGAEFVEQTCEGGMMYNPHKFSCDAVDVVVPFRPECDTRCPPGYRYSDCAINCKKLCSFYDYILKIEGKCTSAACEAGCVDAVVYEIIVNNKCPSNYRWANNNTCVKTHDCMCVSSDGKPVKPGSIYKESECKICQCVQNYYVCDDVCKTKTTPRTVTQEHTTTASIEETERPSTTKSYIVVINTATPPPPCEENLVPLVLSEKLPETVFTASSSKDDKSQPKEAKYNNRVSSWSPLPSDKEPYLLIDLQKPEPVYGISIKGNPKADEYVTSYKILHGNDGSTFSLGVDKNLKPQIYRGSIDQNTPSFQRLNYPFEARFIKIVPLTWHKNISLRADVLGCGFWTTTTSSPTTEVTEVTRTVVIPICTDEMGPSRHPLTAEQIIVSSSKNSEHDKKALSVLKPNAWQPIVDSPTEWIEFNFLEPRNLTGFFTKGGDDGWVEAFTVEYSHDGTNWNPIVDNHLKDVIFPGNFDGDSEVTNYFPMPVQAQYLKIYPVKWHNTIQVRIEILGCYLPYSTTDLSPVTNTVETTTPSGGRIVLSTIAPCNYCPGVPSSNLEFDACECEPNKWWNGTECVARPLCPCVVGSFIYPVGKLFNKEDCSECVCKIGGVADCSAKICGRCEKGLRSFVTATCGCICKPCPPGQRLCETSNICIDTTLWCDGIINCPDDEINCETTETAEFTVKPKPTTVSPKVCPEIECPPGFKRMLFKPRYNRYSSSRFASVKRYKGGRGKRAVKGGRGVKGGVKGVVKGGVKGGIKSAPFKFPSPTTQFQICPIYRCISDKVPPPYKNTTEECVEEECPPGFKKYEENIVDFGNKKCPELVCIPSEVPDSICNITGRTFVTFDGTLFKYDICDHVLARDIEHKEWIIILSKNCTKTCSRDLHVYVGKDHFTFHSDLTVEYNGYMYTIDQLKRIGKQSNDFVVSKVGNVITFNSLTRGFWIEWNSDGDIKIGVVHSLLTKVDGLCGFFDQNIRNDKQKPNGNLAKTTQEFGDSWSAAKETRDACKINTCPAAIQNKAWQLCNTVREEYFSSCSKAVNLDSSVSSCLDTACDCLLASSKENVTNSERCKCQLLQSFVVECLTSDPEAEVSGWRTQYDCPTNCPAPLIYKDCFRRQCEPTCESLSDPKLCPKVEKACYPGCYCPEDLVQKGDKCIKPSECRDCECEVTGRLDFLTYDESNFTISGNCVYVLTRDVISDKNAVHNFQVLITNGPCITNEEQTCIRKITTLYKDHKIIVLVNAVNDTLEIIVDSIELESEQFDQYSDWLKIVKSSNRINILLWADQIEVNINYPSLATTVRVPSYKYSSKLEGLCGDCDRNPDNDLRTPNETITTDIEEFSLSWLFEGLEQSKEKCMVKPKEKCKPLPENENPCVHIIDSTIFGVCHPVVDYSIYQQWCDKETCIVEGEIDTYAVCSIIESYAKSCAKEGICVDWHFDLCPQPNCTSDRVFSACGTTCPKTCENINEKESSCIPEIVEGCFCPEGTALKGDICVPERECIECDDEGHHPGDKWTKDLCTNCTCEEGTVTCHRKDCPAIDTICEQGFTPQKVISYTKECCDKYTCIPQSTTTALPSCATPQPVTCGEDQRPKLSKKDDGCYQNICECIPREECKPIDLSTPSPLEGGYEKIIDESDCCPKVKFVCKPELCSSPPECQQFYVVKTAKDESKCCPVYTCIPPEDKCIFESSYKAAKTGGERPREDGEKQKFLKNPLETWTDGPCRDCQCRPALQGGYQVVCTEKQCPSLEKAGDYNDYQLVPKLIYNQCCPKFVRTACKDDGKIYELGETWIRGNDYCNIYKCGNDTEGNIIEEVHVTECKTDCPLGYDYEPATPESKQCCGTCKAVACAINGTIRREDEEWTSPDYCVQYKCLGVNGTMQVQSKETTCGKISPETLKNYVVNSMKIPGECCNKTEIVACKMVDTVYAIDETWRATEDPCKNYKCAKIEDKKLAIIGYLTTCNTTCPLGYTYNPADPLSDKCCGTCQQAACVVDEQIRAIGETWHSDDYCMKFSCVNVNGMLQVEKNTVKCPVIPEATLENYVVKTEKIPGRCCNKTEITACKANGNIYNPDDTWTVGTDYCKTYKCVKVGQSLGISLSQIKCNTTCPDGYEYKEPSILDEACCGKCQQIACIVNETVRQVGEQWISADFCQKFRCENYNGMLQIAKTNIVCKEIPPETLLNYVVQSTHVPGRCCNKSVVVACRGNDQIYKVGDTWFKNNNYCEKFECVNVNGQLGIREYVSHCNTTCPSGYTYEAPSKNEAKCCGECRQSQCIMNGTLWEIGQEWQSDDHCSQHKCAEINGVIQVLTQNTVCQAPSEDRQKDFVIQIIPMEGECCPSFKEVGCRMGNQTYKLGEKWTTDNLCKNVTCTIDDQGRIVKREIIQTCKEQCDEGYQYMPSSDSCCGSCVSVACVINGALKQPGEVWTSPDGCTRYSCERDEDHMVVSSHSEKCPNLNDCPSNRIYDDGCCKRCNITGSDQVLCGVESIPLDKTVNLVKTENLQHGVCVNEEPIPNFTECMGTCESSTRFDSKLGRHNLVCTCCEAIDYTKIVIPMLCDDGFRWQKSLEVPSACSCSACGGRISAQYSEYKGAPVKSSRKGRRSSPRKVKPMPIDDP